MEELGVFKRIRSYFERGGTKEDRNSIVGGNAIQQCYTMLSQMVQRDPAYYAVLVACRPDQDWKLIHRPGQDQETAVFQSDDVGFGVPIDCVKSLVQGEGTSDIQSTVVFPASETAQKIRLVPGFHRQLNSWLQTSLELKYGNGYKVFGEARDILVQPGDLIICLPQILRWPATFSSSNFLNLSQIGLGDKLSTSRESLNARYNTNSSNKTWQPEPQFCDTERTGGEDNAAKLGLNEDGWCNSSSAIGQALTGRLDWGSDRANKERNCVLGSHGAAAVELVTKSRAQLANQFHKLCDSIDSNMDTGKKNPSKLIASTDFDLRLRNGQEGTTRRTRVPRPQ
jgi:hypothetical protein